MAGHCCEIHLVKLLREYIGEKDRDVSNDLVELAVRVSYDSSLSLCDYCKAKSVFRMKACW